MWVCGKLDIHGWKVTLLLSYAHSTTSQVFYLPPVGTQGFRSPEGSQLVVASDRDVIVPRLTPRSDVWSFGVLILRLFLGVDGPSSQREVVTEHLKASDFDS